VEKRHDKHIEVCSYEWKRHLSYSAFQEVVTEAFSRVPAQYKEKAMVDLECDIVNKDEAATVLAISYSRPETDDEMASRLKKAAELDAKIRQELEGLVQHNGVNSSIKLE